MVPGAADGDVSLEIGCDGAATVQASGGPVFGFKKDIITHAPADALYNPKSGENIGGPQTTFSSVLDEIGTVATGVKNQNTLTWVQSQLSQSQAYLWGGSGTNQAVATDNCILITFY